MASFIDNPKKPLGKSPDISPSNDVNKTEVAVFYNVYLPWPINTTEAAAEIVREQLEQIGTSFENTADHASLYYVSIGRRLDDGMVQNVCSRFNNLSCKRLGYHSKGFEEKTLERLRSYCDDKPANHRVVYLHNKGSYHPGGGAVVDQNVWRRAGTSAATSQLCVHPPDDVCDFCGLLVTPLPWLHIPGNFWTAKCSYINKLLPPVTYENLMTDYIERVAEPLLGNRTMNMLFQKGFKRQGAFFGQGRFTAENWIGSHPSAIPCDVAPVSYIRYWQSRDRYDTPFNFSFAPRRELAYMMDTGEPRIPKYILKKKNLRIRDYHLLGGMITRWMTFYKEIPDENHWVWSYYPDADEWQAAAETYGVKAFEMVAATVAAISRKKQNQTLAASTVGTGSFTEATS
ncbi:expressed unknown protein [Seminavis robusta]|uniref:Cbl-PTB domain-containing protein n=1 Tax=Seminavis robusta TaxID=568900 RepID=A0A9N8DK05_9STRA|nr:expressed unknown protein [Seminavis robusta]|eukprot:Sro185_g080440.1 n/a (401) ;mRNA; f:75324-76601